MKKILPLLIVLISSCAVVAQTVEYTEDKGYSNRFKDVLSLNDVWIVSGDYSAGVGGEQGAYIKGIDNNGDELWQHNIDELFLDFVATSDSTIAVLFGYWVPCDVIQGFPVKIVTLTSDGEILSETTHELELDIFNNPKKLAVVSGDQLIFASGVIGEEGDYSSRLFAFDLIGENLLWQTPWGGEVQHLSTIQNLAAVFSDEQMVLVDDAGARVDSTSLIQPLIDVQPLNDQELLMLWTDGIYLLDSSLEMQQVVEFSEEESATELILVDDSFYSWSAGELKQYDLDFSFITTHTVNLLPNMNVRALAVDSDILALVGNKSLNEIEVYNGNFFRSGALALYSLTNNEQNYDMDLKLKHVQMEDFEQIQVYDDPPLFNFSADVSGYIVNSGSEVVHAVNLNFMKEMGVACGVEMHRHALTNINLIPGDSLFFIVNDLTRTNYYSSSGSGTVDFCLFASSPSNLYDRNEINDVGCASANFGVYIDEIDDISIEIYPNPATSALSFNLSGISQPGKLQVFNSKGKFITEREVSPAAKQWLDISGWPVGIYFARYTTSGKVSESYRFAVVH